MGDPNQNQSEPDIDLDCGRPVSFSYYDDLIGISLRYSHPMVADPEVSHANYNYSNWNTQLSKPNKLSVTDGYRFLITFPGCNCLCGP